MILRRAALAATALMVATPVAAQPGEDIGAKVNSTRLAYRECVLSETMRLGRGNAESGDTILRAVRSMCGPQWQAFYDAFPDGGGVAVAVAAKQRATDFVRTSAENDALAALLNERVKQQPK